MIESVFNIRETIRLWQWEKLSRLLVSESGYCVPIYKTSLYFKYLEMKVITIKVEKNQQQKYCEISPIFPLNEIIKKSFHELLMLSWLFYYLISLQNAASTSFQSNYHDSVLVLFVPAVSAPSFLTPWTSRNVPFSLNWLRFLKKKKKYHPWC